LTGCILTKPELEIGIDSPSLGGDMRGALPFLLLGVIAPSIRADIITFTADANGDTTVSVSDPTRDVILLPFNVNVLAPPGATHAFYEVTTQIFQGYPFSGGIVVAGLLTTGGVVPPGSPVNLSFSNFFENPSQNTECDEDHCVAEFGGLTEIGFIAWDDGISDYIYLQPPASVPESSSVFLLATVLVLARSRRLS
jgi:hypothetical protein